MARIGVLGELRIESSGQPIELTGSWRMRSLLAWLALNPGSHPRGAVAARFWPDVLDSSARASLRNALWALRRALGPAAAETLMTTRDHVGLHGPPAVWVDATSFGDCVADERLDDALALCRGELLAGLDEEWVYDYRDAHRDRVSALLERMAVRAESVGEPATAIAWTRRRVALDPLAEEAQRALILRLSRSGDRAGALAGYARLRQRLRRELGMSPTQETRELVGRLRDDQAVAEPAPPAEPRCALPRAGPPVEGWAPGAPFPLPARLRRRAQAAFVGRERELSALAAVWSGVCDRQGARVALIVGEAGIGKSRLAQELALHVHGQDAVVLHGSANEDLLVPYQHFVEALGHYLAVAAPSELEHRIEPRAAALAPIAPSFPRPAGTRPQEGGRAENRRYRLFESTASLVDELSGDVPLLLLLDDLHWADQSTAALLRHMLESRPDMRVLVLATQRQADTTPGGPLEEALQRLSQQGLVERMRLPGLLDADVAKLAHSLIGQPLPAELVHAIRSEAGGNPFFVQEVIRHLTESDREGGLRSLARAVVPESVREVVNLRLARLDEACVRMLTVAAVIGNEFELAVLERLSDLQDEDLAAALDEAFAAGIVLEPPHSDRERFTFSHALIRRTLTDRLTRAHRRRIHARIAEVLETSRGDAALPEIAHHLCEALPASDSERALGYATRAAEQAIAELAYAEAVELFTQAIAILPHEDERRRILALKRALAYQALTHAVMDTPRPATRAPAGAGSADGPSIVRA